MKNFIISLTFILLSFSLSITLQYCTNQEKLTDYENKEKIQQSKQSDNTERSTNGGGRAKVLRQENLWLKGWLITQNIKYLLILFVP